MITLHDDAAFAKQRMEETADWERKVKVLYDEALCRAQVAHEQYADIVRRGRDRNKVLDTPA